ncbi:MAG: RNA-binding protein [Chloroflexota bacterium]|nr:RNA-binding protein [Chloroflexota bacterium]
MSTRLFVGNLSYQTTEEDLRALFAGVASVASVTLVTERDTGRSKGFAFVEMATPEDAQKAISQLNGQALHDRTIRVDLARPREERGAGGDRGARRGGGNRERRDRY